MQGFEQRDDHYIIYKRGILAHGRGEKDVYEEGESLVEKESKPMVERGKQGTHKFSKNKNKKHRMENI